ncbi:DUF1056 family protein [Liquorilactobacillus mali]|uniref:DUF1056 family protein n=1 Tax=Liquorilactobacillus mali TaxID=1618 RepID=UPI0002491DAE|nr:DUF1056 family protein [Liquorilactobacillus mali]EJF00337.1 hypothetical protein LMA_03663 [Liquorilactobacillus mali KCTC 3596 = DSM 20444]QFQ74572.1 DUF1056 family protein [Liquorilactobacillus mali]
MLFKPLLKLISTYFDVICFVLALLMGVIGAFMFSIKIGIIAIAISLLILGFISELISSVKGGGN